MQIFLRNFAHFSVKNFALCKKITFFYAKYCRKIFNAKITAKICKKIYEKINGKHLNLLIHDQAGDDQLGTGQLECG